MSNLKKIFLFLLAIFLPGFLFAADETLTITTYYPSPYGSYNQMNIGVGSTTAYAKLTVSEFNESTTQTNFNQTLVNSGINIETEYTVNAFTPGIFWSTNNNNVNKPKAGIYLKETGSGTFMHFGTSSNYATGITNDGIVINATGAVGIGTTAPSQQLQITGSVAIGDASDEYLHIGNNFYASTPASQVSPALYVYKAGNVAYGLKLQNIGGNYGTMIFGPNQASRFINFGKISSAGTPAGDADFGTEYMRINLDNGNVGIGGIPVSGADYNATKLLINSDQGTTYNSATRVIYSGSTSVLGEVALLAHRNNMWNQLYISGSGSSTTNAMLVEGTKSVIINGPSVGIGMTNPSNTLHVTGTIGATQWIGSGCEGACEGSGGYAVLYPQGDLVVNPGAAGAPANSFGLYTGAGSLPGYGSNNYPTVKTSYTNMYFSSGGAYSAYMDSGGVWHPSSSRGRKENFRSLNAQEILDKIEQLPVLEWNYKNQDPSIKHIGPFSEDFHRIFGLGGSDDKTIGSIDPPGVALIGIKALSSKVETQQRHIEKLQKEIDELKSQLKRR